MSVKHYAAKCTCGSILRVQTTCALGNPLSHEFVCVWSKNQFLLFDCHHTKAAQRDMNKAMKSLMGEYYRVFYLVCANCEKRWGVQAFQRVYDVLERESTITIRL